MTIPLEGDSVVEDPLTKRQIKFQDTSSQNRSSHESVSHKISPRPSLNQKRIDPANGLKLFTQAPLEQLRESAELIRLEKNPHDYVTFVADTNPNYTNICNADCSFCSFYRKKGMKDAYTKSVEEVMQSFEMASNAGITTVLLQGGLHPDLTLDYYTELIRTARQRYPSITPHFFSAPEIYQMSRISSLSYEHVLEALWDAGQRTLPGGGAEILSERIRKKISPKKMEPGAWIEIHRAAHKIGFKSTATMMYGHLEESSDILEHLEALRALQDEYGGFTAFIPWSYKRIGNPLGRRVKGWAGEEAYFRILSFSRIYLDNFDHIQASWFSEGRQIGIKALRYGADDFGGLVLEEEVHRATQFINKTHIDQVVAMIHEAGYDAAQRTTLYDIITTYQRGHRPDVAAQQRQYREEQTLPVLSCADQVTLCRWKGAESNPL